MAGSQPSMTIRTDLCDDNFTGNSSPVGEALMRRKVERQANALPMHLTRDQENVDSVSAPLNRRMDHPTPL